MVCVHTQQKKLASDADRQRVKTLTISALERIEHLKTLPAPKPSASMDDLISQLEKLPPPSKTLGVGKTAPGSSRSLPRGNPH